MAVFPSYRPKALEKWPYNVKLGTFMGFSAKKLAVLHQLDQQTEPLSLKNLLETLGSGYPAWAYLTTNLKHGFTFKSSLSLKLDFVHFYGCFSQSVGL